MSATTTFYNIPHPRISLTRPDSLPQFTTFQTRFTRTGRFTPIRATAADSARLDPISFYDLLGIETDVSLCEIKQAYRDMARRYHPDVSPPGRVEEYTEKFIRVQEAYETLSDPGRRAMYDGDLGKGLNLAFGARRRTDEQEMEDKSEWKNRWQSQLSELKRRSTYKNNARGHMSWSAKLRRQRNEVSSDEV